MGYRTDITEGYWTLCYGDVSIPCGLNWCSGLLGIPYPCGIKWCTITVPYPCIKYRVVSKYCYTFTSVKDDCKVFLETHYGCEDGREYKWTDGCFGWFTQYRSGVHVCFDEPLEDLGPCRGGYSLPHGDVPQNAQWQEGVAVGGFIVAPFYSEQGREGRTRKMGSVKTVNDQFAPPMHIRKFCAPCLVGRIIIVAAAFFGLACGVRWIL